jgi:hypothetical protein
MQPVSENTKAKDRRANRICITNSLKTDEVVRILKDTLNKYLYLSVKFVLIRHQTALLLKKKWMVWHRWHRSEEILRQTVTSRCA